MINSEKKIQFPFIRKNDPQSVIVIVGLWVCVATVAIILILNFSARKKSPSEIKNSEIKQSEKNTSQSHSHYSKYSHAGYSQSGNTATKQ